MSHDRFHEGAGERQIRVQAHMTPNQEFIDVTVTKPNSRLSFRSIKTNRFLRTIFPLTATQSLANNIRDRSLRVDSEAFCSIEGNQVNTFDNVTYRVCTQYKTYYLAFTLFYHVSNSQLTFPISSSTPKSPMTVTTFWLRTVPDVNPSPSWLRTSLPNKRKSSFSLEDKPRLN